MKIERFKADLTLLVVAVVWGSAFVAQRVAAENIGVFLFNGLRFLLGALILLPLTRRRGSNPLAQGHLSRKQFLGIVLLGSLLFTAAAFQQFGLQFTTAGNAGFVTGLYVVLIPLVLALGWHQPSRPSIWLASFFAVIGLFLLSTGGRLFINSGDLLELAGAFVWAFHVIMIGKLVQYIDVPRLAVGQYLVCGVINLAVGLGFETNSLGSLTTVWWAVVYTGLFSIGLGYTLQAVAQKVAPPADAAIILSMEAVFAALFGWLLLGEMLTVLQLLGCGLILFGMLLAQAPVLAQGRAEKPEIL